MLPVPTNTQSPRTGTVYAAPWSPEMRVILLQGRQNPLPLRILPILRVPISKQN